MEFHPFPARLFHLQYGVTTYGQARFVLRDRALDFTDEFVPLLPLGSQASVAWVQGDSIPMEFAGEVYLSSPDFVRITGVGRELFAAAAPLFAQNISFPCRLSAARGEPPAAATAIYLSPGRVTLLTGLETQPGQALWLDAEIDFLTLRRLRLTVEQRHLLRRGQYLTVCGVQPASNENLIALNAFSARLDKLEDLGLD